MKKEPITWRTEKRKISDLIPAEYNPRKMTEQERRDLGDSIKEFGTVIPIVVNTGKRNNVLIGGHQRVKIYTDEKRDEVDVMVPSRELTVSEEKRLNLRLNKNTGSWDLEKLKDIDLTTLLEVGFGDEELGNLWDDVDMLDDSFDFNREIKKVETPKTKKGDIYILGEHRLMCGNPFEKEEVQILMGTGDFLGTETAEMVVLDPPDRLDETFFEALKDQDTKDDKYGTFLSGIIENAVGFSKPNAHIFTWVRDENVWMVQGLYRENGLANKRVCVWIRKEIQSAKNRNAFNSCFEPCVYATKGRTPYLSRRTNTSGILNKEIGQGNQLLDDVREKLNIWTDINPREEGEYKDRPITLMERPLQKCTAPGHTVLIVFGGSGSSLIACQQIARKARIIEHDPAVCDTIVKRWEEWTNKKAKKI
jgi:DNA modification methylase